MFNLERIFTIGRLGRASTNHGIGTESNKRGTSFGNHNCDFLLGTRNHVNINGTKTYTRDIPCKKYMDVKCKTALITGGASGIGLAIADTLLTAGLEKAYLGDINSCKGIKALLLMKHKHGEGRCDFIPIDVTNYKQFEDAFKYVTCKEGSVDILVNNAGILDDRSWETEFDTNVKGVIRGTLLANKYMPYQKNKGGVVVNVSSILGFDNSPYAPGYGSTKHALIGLTRSFGEPSKFSGNRVRHIAIGPGVTGTEMVQDLDTKMLTEEWGKKLTAFLNSLPFQTPDPVGRGALYTIEYGPPGSLWVIEDCALKRVMPPNRGTYQKKVMDL